MKDKIILNGADEIQYVTNLIEANIKLLEITLASKQKFLRKFKDDVK